MPHYRSANTSKARRNTNAVQPLADADKTCDTSSDVGRKTGDKSESDLLALAIAIAAIIMIVGTGGSVLPDVVASLAGLGLGPDRLLASALLLNIALVIFGWRRYRDLHDEIHEHRLAEKHARRLSETDPLTGCLNRRSMNLIVDRLIGRSHENGRRVAVIMIDIDNFKQLNDFHGHAVGDQILQTCARRISKLLPEDAILARMGGDEFAGVLAFDPLRVGEVDHIAASIIEDIASPIALDEVSSSDEHQEFGCVVSASLGLARSDTSVPGEDGGPAETAGALLHMADLAMYQAKKSGRNRHVWFDDTMLKELRYRSDLETAIRQGIAAGEFVPYYEQQVDLTTGDLCGFEMLARWHSPSLGLVNPEVFIPIAEEIGAIGELSERLIVLALRDAKNWAPHLTLSVNVSPIQLRDPWFAQKILKLLLSEGVPPGRLDVEITESCLHENLDGVKTLVASLRNQGIGVSLDDFGTGYSSIAQLRALPFDRIKIDRSFVATILDNHDSATIVDAINSLGKGLGLPITAEGIENEAVLERLRELGNLKGQGYLYGRPQPAKAVHEMLAQRGLLAGVTAKTIDPEIMPNVKAG